MQLGEQERMHTLPNAGLLPLDHPPVTGRARAETELKRQMPPRDPRVEHKQDPLQGSAIIKPLATRIAKATLDPRQLIRHAHPKPVRHDPRR
jgi:hypothetical protein